MQLKNVVFDTFSGELPEISHLINPPDYEADDTVIVCDSDERAGMWIRKGFACIGLEQGETMKSVKYVTDSQKNIDDDYLELVYCRSHGLPLTICGTDRLLIREMTEKDVKGLYDIYKGNVTEFAEPLYEYEEELEFTRKYIENMYGFYGYGLWILERKCDGRMIGRAGLSNRIVDGENEIELGYVVGEEYQRQGYGSEACSAILEYGFQNLGVQRIIACIDKKNVPSLRLAHRLGFCTLPAQPEEGRLLLYKLRN